MSRSDFIFMIEKTQQSENNKKFGKGTTYAKGAKKMAGKYACAQLARKSKERHFSR